MLSTGLCTTGPVSTRRCGRCCARPCARHFVGATPCGRCTDATRHGLTPNEAGSTTGATRRSGTEERGGSIGERRSIPGRATSPAAGVSAGERQDRSGDPPLVRRPACRTECDGRGDTRGSCRSRACPGRPTVAGEAPRTHTSRGLVAFRPKDFRRSWTCWKRAVTSSVTPLHRTFTGRSRGPLITPGRLRKGPPGGRHVHQRHHLAGPLLPPHGPRVDQRSRGPRQPGHLLTMALVVILNPLNIGTAQDRNRRFSGGSNVVASIAAVTAATALGAALVTIAMGSSSRLPVALPRSPTGSAPASSPTS